MNKFELRKKYLHLRNRLTQTDEKSKEIVTRIIDEAKFQQAKVIGVYSSFKNEVDLSSLVYFSLANRKIVCMPIVVDDSEMVFCKLNSIEDLINTNKYGIKEPTLNKSKIIAPVNFDVILVPGICFDKHKNRIGFGKGYYDKYLHKAINAYNIGVCFDEQLLKGAYIETKPYDVVMDKIITDKIIIT